MKLFLIFGLSIFFALISIRLIRNIAQRLKLYDYPNLDLTIHKRPIPLLGGIGMFISILTTLLITYVFIINLVKVSILLSILIGGMSVLILGLWDDLKWKGLIKKITYKSKFLLQIFICIAIGAILYSNGCSIKLIPIGVFGLFLMAFYILGGMNAINMQDGLDGLAAGVVAISTIGFLYLSILSANNLGLILSLSLLGGSIGFLIFNFHPASIFMGDNGSHFLGYMVAVLAIIFTSKPYDIRWFFGPILIVGFPVVDCAWAMLRRFFQKKNICQGDRGHIYDRIMQNGFSVKKTVLICYLIQSVFVAGGVALTQL